MLKSVSELNPRGYYPRILRTAAYIGLLTTAVLLVTVQPALAQENPVCQDGAGTIVDMIEGFIQITTTLGVMGLFVVWQSDSLMEMFLLDPDQHSAIKAHRLRALKSATMLIVLGPLFTIFGTTMNLPIAECVDLIPF